MQDSREIKLLLFHPKIKITFTQRRRDPKEARKMAKIQNQIQLPPYLLTNYGEALEDYVNPVPIPI